MKTALHSTPPSHPLFGYKEGLWYFSDRTISPEGIDIPSDTELSSSDFILGNLEPRQASQSFATLSRLLFDAVGGFDGWLVLGHTLAYAAYPELNEKYFFPGLWITGKRGCGKSTIAQWLLRVWGLSHERYPFDNTCTPRFLRQRLTRLSALPVCFDEFAYLKKKGPVKNTDLEKFDILKSAVTPPAKNPFHTTPIVLGETAAPNAVLRARYFQVTIDPKLRSRPCALAGFQETEKLKAFFPNLGHYLLVNRLSFLEKFNSFLFFWISVYSSNKRPRPSFRECLIAGIPYAAWSATLQILPNHPKLKFLHNTRESLRLHAIARRS